MATATRLLLVVLLLFAATPAPSLAESFVVGGRKHRWAPNINYTDWADQNQFHVGDWLGTILPFLPLHTQALAIKPTV